MTLRRCYTAADCADLLDHSIDWFYENRRRLHDEHGMPRPAVPGRIRIERASFDAWLARYHPAMPQPAANCSAPPIAPQAVSDELARAYLRAAYAGR